MSEKKIKIAVYMDVTIPQLLALQCMFDYWNFLSNVGSSRRVGYYVDGDGDFHPHCQIVNLTTEHIPRLNDEMKRISVVDGLSSGDHIYDYDPIAWKLDYDKKERKKWLEERQQITQDKSIGTFGPPESNQDENPVSTS